VEVVAEERPVPGGRSALEWIGTRRPENNRRTLGIDTDEAVGPVSSWAPPFPRNGIR
jgi:hypothetical protein